MCSSAERSASVHSAAWAGKARGHRIITTSIEHHAVGQLVDHAALDLLPDGSILLRTGVADLGQGTATAMGLIAAEELGVPFERVAVQLGDTATTPDAGPAVGSRVTFFVGNAVRNAAADLRERSAVEQRVDQVEPLGQRVGLHLAEERRHADVSGRDHLERGEQDDQTDDE